MTAFKSFAVSVFTNGGERPLSKTLSLSGNGTLQKIASGSLYDGYVERREFGSLQNLVEFLATLGPRSAVAFGVCEFAKARILTKDRLKRTPLSDGSAVARDRQHFRWPDGPGVLFLDYDPLPNEPVIEPHHLIASLRLAVPELRSVSIAHKPSTSSCLNRRSGEVVRGVEGQHLFVLLEKASDAPLVGQTIAARLRLAGQSSVIVRANGQMISRGPFDEGVWQPERLIFGTAQCLPPLTQVLAPTLYPGDCDDVLG